MKNMRRQLRAGHFVSRRRLHNVWQIQTGGMWKMRCRYVNKIYMNEGNGFTVALYSTQDTSVPLSARDKYLASRKMIGFTAVGYNLPLTDQIELEMEGAWENGSHGLQYRVESFMEKAIAKVCLCIAFF